MSCRCSAVLSLFFKVPRGRALTIRIVLADKLQELLDKAKDPEALSEERKEMEELKALLPEIQEKVEDATEGMKTASTAADAVKDVLVSQECRCFCMICEITASGLVIRSTFCTVFYSNWISCICQNEGTSSSAFPGSAGPNVNSAKVKDTFQSSN